MNLKDKQNKAIRNAAGFINHYEIDEGDCQNFLDSIEEDNFCLVPKELMHAAVDAFLKERKYLSEDKIDNLNHYREYAYADLLFMEKVKDWMDANSVTKADELAPITKQSSVRAESRTVSNKNEDNHDA